MPAQLLAERRGAVLLLRISNPDARNALHPDIYRDGLAALHAAGADPAVRAVVLAGEGEHFCAGGNLNRLRENRTRDPSVQAASIDQLGAWILAMRECPKPIVAPVEGAAAGAGFSLVLACDLIVAAENARFVLSYVKVGLTPDGGASHFLAARLPYPLAYELAAAGQPVGAARLHALGLVNVLTAPGEAMAAALARAAELADAPAFALGRIKSLRASHEHDALARQLVRERDNFVAALFHDDAGEGIDAFLAKRPPRFNREAATTAAAPDTAATAATATATAATGEAAATPAAPTPPAATDAALGGTAAVPERHRVDTEALSAWLRERVPGFAGPLAIELFKGGQSNPTYKLVTPGATYVMRAKPGPAARLLPSAHAIEREYRVLEALGRTDIPVARVHALCEDESVIGRAFYVMEFVDGRVMWEQSLPGLSNAERTAIYDEMNRVIAALHSVDYGAIGLGDYGKPGNYFERQIGRWSKQYQASQTEPIEAMDRLIEWLPQHVPPGDETSIVHGDYRLDNLIFERERPRIRALLDWELSTLGHPLADFSYHCMAWHIAPGQFRGIAGLDHAALGIPSEHAYVEAYCRRTGRDPARTLAHWDFYLAYNMFRLAAILQGIMKRAADGTASSAQALEAGRRARPLAEMGWQIAQRVR